MCDDIWHVLPHFLIIFPNFLFKWKKNFGVKGVHLCKIFEKSIFFVEIFCIFKIWLMMSLGNFHEFNLIKVWQGAKCHRKQYKVPLCFQTLNAFF